MKKTYAAVALALTAALAVALAAEDQRESDRRCEARLKEDVTFLASPDCEGRGPRTRGLKRAGDHVAAQFKDIGLETAFGDGYFQPFTLGAVRAEVTLFG